jgi:nitroreductase
MKQRRSVRDYTREEVSAEDVWQLIEAARLAPSAGNVQPWEFVIIKDLETKHRLSNAALNQSFIENAPVVIVVCADIAKAKRSYGIRGESLYCLQDTAAATENIILAAQALGLATCWVGAFREDEVAKTVNAPSNMMPVAIVPVGHPAKKPVAPHKRAVNDVIHYEAL